MAAETKEAAGRSSGEDQGCWAGWAQNQESLLSYWDDISKLYTQAFEQGLRLMMPQTSPGFGNTGGFGDGVSELIKAMERSQEMLFTQFESITAFQSALWEPWFKQFGMGPAGQRTGSRPRKGGKSD